MNFIPFVLIFVTAISFYCDLILSTGKYELKQLNLIETQNFLDHCIDREVIETAFYYLPGKIKLAKKKIYENNRENTDHYERSKCNLYYCLNSTHGIDFFNNLLKKIYSPMTSDESELVELTNEIKKQFSEIKDHKESISLIDLCPKPIKLKNLYKNILIGSYNIPKLEELFFIDKNAQHKPLCFRYAKMPLFSEALGVDLSKKYLIFEKTIYDNSKKKVTKQQFLDFLDINGISEQNRNDLIKIFTFKEPNKKVIHCLIKEPNLMLESSRIFLF